MKNFFSSFVLLSLLSLPIISCSLIETTCKNTPNYKLCVSALRSDPRSSKAAGVAGLGLILVDVVKSKATQALNYMEKIGKSNPKMGARMRECVECYKAVLVADVPEATEALTKGNPKFAEDGMADAYVEAEACEKSYGKAGVSPVTEMNGAMRELSAVARSVIRMLL